MFTTLNLTLTSQLPQEIGVLPEASGGGLQTLDDTTFAASLSVSLEDLAETGNPLPLAGIELPIDGATTLSPGANAREGLPLPPVEELTPDPRVMPVEWPPGLESANAQAPVPDLEPAAATAAAVIATSAESAETPTLASPVSDARDLAMKSETTVAASQVLANAGGIRASAPTARDSEISPTPGTPELGAITESPEADAPELAELMRTAEARGERALTDNPGARLPGAPLEAVPKRILDSGLQGPASSNIAEGTASANALNTAATIQRATPNPGSNVSVLPSVSTPVAEPGWGESIADRVLLMANNRLGNAEIRLTPAELGPVRVQVSVEDGTANVAFQATQGATREALEQALPRLRDMLQENGLSLSHASVSDQGVRDGGREAAEDSAPVADGSTDSESGAEFTDDQQTVRSPVSNGLVDTFV